MTNCSNFKDSYFTSPQGSPFVLTRMLSLSLPFAIIIYKSSDNGGDRGLDRFLRRDTVDATVSMKPVFRKLKSSME